MLIKRLLFKRILILLQNSICGIIDAYSYGRKATPQNGRVSSALSVSKEKGPDLFQSPTFCAASEDLCIKCKLSTERQLFHNPRKKKTKYIRRDYSAMKILICYLRNQGKNMVTIAWTLRIYPLVPANFDRCMQETKLVKNIYSRVVRNSSFPC